MRKAGIFKLLTIVLAANLLLGCAGYKAVDIPKLQPEFSPTAQKQNDVVAAVRVLTVDDCRRYFDFDIIEGVISQFKLPSKTSLRSIGFSPEWNKPAERSPRRGSQEMSQVDSRPRYRYGVAALFLWPLAIPAVVDGVKSSKANTRMDTDFVAKGLQDTVIPPYNTINGIIFVPVAEFRPDLIINLINKETRDKLTFQFNNIK